VCGGGGARDVLKRCAGLLEPVAHCFWSTVSTQGPSAKHLLRIRVAALVGPYMLLSFSCILAYAPWQQCIRL
jgi:hypothetical protein